LFACVSPNQNKKYAEPNRTVEFYFDCGGEFALLLEYDPDPNGCDQTLSLVEKAGNEKHQLGWWDLARWHPFCLKPDEFETLLQYWDRFDPRWTQSPVPRLLLFNFVGIEDSETVEALAAAAGSALERLGVRELSNDPAVALRNFLENEGGYEWKFDERRGWLFASGEYDCYSLRNECHAGGEEGTFPFEKYGQLIAAVKTALKNY
ncbi:MAG: hypothetical protein JSS81_30270, partial [Acidobacteria bacterium]|nr:hypothetical protein [Acidobacteriota bacterium]